MKKLFFIFSAALLLMAQGSLAQEITCANISFIGINPNPDNPDEYLISMEFTDANNSFISYPYLPAVFNSSGDTIGEGYIFFFGQIANTVTQYPITVTEDFNPSEFNFQFVYTTEIDTDTCYFSFFDVNNIEHVIEEKNTMNIWPNPAKHFINIETPSALIGQSYSILDISGRVIQKNLIQSELTTLNLQTLTSGIYFIKTDNDSSVYRVVKE
jgi:hypothetical protein